MVVLFFYFCHAVFMSHTCRREVLCSFFWTLEERWWNSTAIRPRWAKSWFGLDSSANMLKELSSLFSWLASSMFSWGRSGITTAADSACRYTHRWSVSHSSLSIWLSVWANNYIGISDGTRQRSTSCRSHLAVISMKSSSWLERLNQFVLLDFNLLHINNNCCVYTFTITILLRCGNSAKVGYRIL